VHGPDVAVRDLYGIPLAYVGEPPAAAGRLVRWAEGAPAVRAWARRLFDAGHRVRPGDYRTSGDGTTVAWDYEATSDALRRLGVGPTAGVAELTHREGKIAALTLTSDGAAVREREAAAARAMAMAMATSDPHAPQTPQGLLVAFHAALARHDAEAALDLFGDDANVSLAYVRSTPDGTEAGGAPRHYEGRAAIAALLREGALPEKRVTLTRVDVAGDALIWAGTAFVPDHHEVDGADLVAWSGRAVVSAGRIRSLTAVLGPVVAGATPAPVALVETAAAGPPPWPAGAASTPRGQPERDRPPAAGAAPSGWPIALGGLAALGGALRALRGRWIRRRRSA
jgi:hypothetical protein